MKPKRVMPASTRGWCGWAVGRTRGGSFFAQKDKPKIARVALKLIGRLYAWERTWDQAGVTQAQARADLRAQHIARPLRWLHSLAFGLISPKIVLPGSLTGKACTNLLNQWEPLTEHVRYGDTRIDNDRVENSIRPSAIGKKNWLFIGHPDAGQRSGDPLHVGRLLPAPRQGSLGLVTRYAHWPAPHDQPGRPRGADPGPLATARRG
jgi:hypothetical protein